MEPDTKITLFRLALCVPVVFVTTSAILGWLSRHKPAAAHTALLLALLPCLALIAKILFADWKSDADTVVDILLSTLFLASTPWCFFFAWRARKTGGNRTVTACALAITGFLLIPLIGFTCTVCWMFVTISDR